MNLGNALMAASAQTKRLISKNLKKLIHSKILGASRVQRSQVLSHFQAQFHQIIEKFEHKVDKCDKF